MYKLERELKNINELIRYSDIDKRKILNKALRLFINGELSYEDLKLIVKLLRISLTRSSNTYRFKEVKSDVETVVRDVHDVDSDLKIVKKEFEVINDEYLGYRILKRIFGYDYGD